MSNKKIKDLGVANTSLVEVKSKVIYFTGVPSGNSWRGATPGFGEGNILGFRG